MSRSGLGRWARRGLALLPDTVVGHTALVLVGALVLSVGLALGVFAVQRSEALTALGLRNKAERVADLVHLLDTAPADSRRALLHTVDTPGFHAGWGEAPLVLMDEERGVAAVMGMFLRHHLADREIRISAEPPPPPFPPPPFPPSAFRDGGPGWDAPPGASADGPRDEQGGGPGARWGMRPGALLHRGGTGFGPALRVSVLLSDGSWLNIYAPLDPPETLWRMRFLAPILLSLLVVIGVALWAVAWAVRPFGIFAAAAERLGVDVAAPALAENGPREVRRAAHAFNVMQARIRRFVDDRTQMLAAISHDLRTPITRLKLRAEFVEDEAERSRMLADLDEMEHMIASTLAFARDDAAREERRQVDCAALLQGLVDDAVAGGGDATYAGPDNLVLRARPSALKRAFANLIENAMKYGRRAGVRVMSRPGEVVVDVEDDGPGIPEADRERVFSPFVRLEVSRSRDTGGTGLGLSIARAAVRAHGGDIQLANRSEGGLRVRVLLPIA